MPIQFYPNTDFSEIGVKISGSNFQDLLEVIKEHRLKFHKEYDGLQNIWIGSRPQIKELLPSLGQIEHLRIPVDFAENLEPTFETEYFDIDYDESLLKRPPLGQYQIDGIKKGISQSRYFYAWDMGTGKSYTVISVLNHLFHYGIVDRVLIMAPSESVYNFKEYLFTDSTFVESEDDIYIADVNNRDPFEVDPKVIIMTYRTLIMLSDDFYYKKTGKKSKKYSSAPLPFEQWGTNRALILDESHKAKNISSRTAKLLHRYKRNFRCRYNLSGTPDPNGTEGYYSQITLLEEALIDKDYTSWLSDIAVLSYRFSQYNPSIQYYKPDEVKKFVNRIEPWVGRLFTKDVLELPELMYDPVYVQMNSLQQRIYQEFVTYTLGVIKEQEGELVPKVVYQKFPYLMQALEDPCLLKGKIDPELSPALYRDVEKWRFEDHSQLDAFDSLLSNYVEDQNKKVIIWDGHPGTMNRLAERYKKYNPITIHGQTEVPKDENSSEYRKKLLDNFKQKDEHKVLIASYKVLSTAVNITEANVNLYWSAPWDYGDYAQSMKRTHRYGQNETVYVKPFVILGTLSVLLHKSLNRKEKMNNELFNANSLPKEQWKAIFEGNV